MFRNRCFELNILKSIQARCAVLCTHVGWTVQVPRALKCTETGSHVATMVGLGCGLGWTQSSWAGTLQRNDT